MNAVALDMTSDSLANVLFGRANALKKGELKKGLYAALIELEQESSDTTRATYTERYASVAPIMWDGKDWVHRHGDTLAPNGRVVAAALVTAEIPSDWTAAAEKAHWGREYKAKLSSLPPPEHVSSGLPNDGMPEA